MNEAKTTTRKQILTIKYNNLVKKLKELEFLKGKCDLFPKLEDIDISDIVFYMQFLFTNNTDEFRENIKSALTLKSIQLTNEEFEEVHKIVFPFLKFIYEFI